MNEDLINALFLLGACGALLSNCYRTFKDKGVKGISIFNIIFFSCMTSYQTYYWFSLSKFFSFYGNLFAASIQITWLCMVLHYRRIENRKKAELYILKMWGRD